MYVESQTFKEKEKKSILQKYTLEHGCKQWTSQKGVVV